MVQLEKWARMNYHPCIPLGDNGSKITGCERHIQLSREAAQEGIVLLKNDKDILPFKNGTRIAIFGKAQIDYVKCGGGSGDVHSVYTRNIYEGLKLKHGKVEVFDKLSLYYAAYVEEQYKDGGENGRLDEVEIPAELLDEAKHFTDTAIITINRYSSEGEDRKNDGNDTYFVLSDSEKLMIKTVCDAFENVVVLLNTGAMIDTSWFADNDKIQAALMIWQGGMEGALAAADVLVGDVCPSGKLVDTCARNFEDYPSSANFHESEDYVEYTEDIFVGYRYFATIPDKKSAVVYPFGYGLSYTKFEFSDALAVVLGDKITVNVTVKNIGCCAGKEVVQLYCSAPEGKLTKPAIELCAFEKTKLLQPGEQQTLILSFSLKDAASFDDIGAVQKSAWVLEKGFYRIYIGNSAENLFKLDLMPEVCENRIVEQLSSYCAPQNLTKRLNADGTYTAVTCKEMPRKEFECDYICGEKIPQNKDAIKKLICVVNGEISLDEFLMQLTDAELMHLLQGQFDKGIAHTGGMGNLPEYGIPTALTADGPAGLRADTETGIRTTAFPVATMLACTWNTELVEKVGAAAALECKENNISIWLTPALNIHRSPLCGRNFEYFSEDPYISGKMAAAITKGIQSQGVVATPKHFACNNKETNRYESDSIVSERALREIYLKGFEICVKEAKPKLIMTSYNRINGVRASENTELITGILRGEWGYDGLVTTDWWSHGSKAAEVISGNDIRMPATSPTDLKEKYEQGIINRNQLAICAKRMIEMLLWLD